MTRRAGFFTLRGWLLTVSLLVPARPALAQDQSSVAVRLATLPTAERDAILDREGLASVELFQALLAVGLKALVNGEYDGCAKAAAAAESVARRVRADVDIARALTLRGTAYFRQSKFDPSETVLREALTILASANDPRAEADAWLMLGYVQRSRADYELSLESIRKAEGLWRKVDDRLGIARAVGTLAHIHKALSRWDEALTGYQEAFKIFEALDDRPRMAIVLESIGNTLSLRGEQPEALQYTLRALAISESLADRVGIHDRLNILGAIYQAQGAYARALDAYQRCLRGRLELGELLPAAETLHNIGMVHASQGNDRLAIDTYKRSLRMNATAGNNKLLTAEALYNIAVAARRLGEHQRSRANLLESLRISEQNNFRQFVAANLHALGRWSLDRRRLSEAAPLLARALALREDLRDQSGIAETLNTLASVALARQEPDRAIASATRARDIAAKFDQHELLWEAHTLIGMAHRQGGHLDQAERSFSAAVDVIEGLRRQIVAPQFGRERYFETRVSPYHELIELAMSRGAKETALEIGERAKARSLADLQRGRRDITSLLDDTEKREDRRLRSLLLTLNQRIHGEQLSATPDAQRLESLERERDARRRDYEAFQSAVYSKHPEAALLRATHAPFKWTEAAPIVSGSSSAVLVYTLTARNAYLFVLSRTSAAPKLDALRLDVDAPALAQLAATLRGRLARRDLAFAGEARRAYQMLLQPAQRMLQGRTQLIIVPDGALWEIPFQALIDERGEYLIKSASIAYAPSLAMLQESNRSPLRQAGERTLLAMGKAEFGAKGDLPTVPLMSDFGPLPEAERQVRRIAALYGADRSTIHLGREAREDRFKSDAPRHSIVHLATHGVLDESSPLYSHLVLSPSADRVADDGLLEAWELLDLRLDAEVVVLAACETGRGRIASGEGIVGMMWALFAAGAQSTIASQWKVEASSTNQLMIALHRRLASGELSKSEALRRASLEVLRDDRYAHPFYWAPFVLVGDPR
jgi:CHAT domain-containing protein/Tfp pilus assembly protein PilF